MAGKQLARFGALAFAASCAAAAGIVVATAASTHQILQSGRMFAPTAIDIRKGDTLRIVNNDADLLHHAYIDEPSFKFDSGEQEPGTSTDITFTETGTFQVLCGIHPKMRLDVTVK